MIRNDLYIPLGSQDAKLAVCVQRQYDQSSEGAS